MQEGDGEAPAGGAAADGEGAGTATARPATARRDEIAQKYADALGQPEAKDFHRSFADSILNGDAAGLKYLSNGLNDKGKKVFTAVTGAKLPRGQAKTWDAIQDWAKSQEVANGKKAEVSGQEETARTGVDAANGNGERLAGERLPDSGVQGGATVKEPAIIGSDGKDAVTPGVSDQHDTASTGHGPLESTGATSQVQAAGEGSNGRAPGASSGTPVATGPDQRPEHQALQLRGDGAVKPGQSNPTGTDKRDGRAVLEAPPAPTEPVTVQTGSMDGKKIPAPAAPGSIGKQGKRSTKGTFTLDSTGLQQAYEALWKLARAGKEALPHLETIARATFQEGARTWQEFAKSMKQKLGELWDRFKGMVHDVYQRVQRLIGSETGRIARILGNEIGTVSPDLQRDFAQRHNIALDKSDAAIAAKNYEEADKWLAKADEIQAQWKKLKGEDEYVRDPEQVNQEGRGSSGDIEQPDSEAVLGDDQGGSGETARTDSVDVPAGRQTSIKNAVTESEEEGGPIPRDGGFTHQSLVDIGRNKVENDPLYNIRDRARKIASNPLEPTNIEDYSALLYDKVRLLKQGDALRELRIAAVAANDPREIARTRQAVAVIEDDFEANRQATVIAGRWGFSAHGHLRQTYVDDDYQVIPMVNTAEMITGKKLDTEANLRTIIEKQAEEIARTKKAFQDAVEKSELEKQQRGVQRIKNDEATAPASRRRAKREVSREQNDQAFKSLASKLRDVLSPYRLSMNFNSEAAAVLTDMMRLRIANGVTKAADIIDDIYDELHGDYAIEKRDIADALSGYGKQFTMSQEELDVTSREVKRQLRLMSALEDAEAGIIPGQSGLKHDKQTEEVRRLREKVKQAMKASGIDNKSTLDPESQWKTSLDAVKTRLRNRRTDVKRQIDAKKRDPVKKTGIKYDQEALALQEEVNHLNEMLDAIDSKPGISAQRRIEMVINSLDKSIANLERQIATGDEASKAKVTGVETQEIAKRRAKLDILRKTRDQMRKDALPPKVPKTEAEKEAIYNKAYRTRLINRRTDVKRQIAAKKRDPVKKTGIKYDQESLALQEEVNHLNEMLDAIDSKPGISAQRRIEMVINSLDKSIANLERQIATGDEASKAKVTGVETQEIAKRRAKLDILRKTRDQMRKDALPPKVPKTEAEKEAIYNKAYRTRLEKMKATLDEKRANGDYEKSARKVHQLEESTKQAKADYEKSKQKWDTMRRQLERENRGTVEKIADTALGLQRFAILTSSGIIVKILAVAAYLRPLESMTEGLASEVNRRMPFLSLISEGAPRHGSGISVRGEAAGLVQLFKRETYRNAWQRLLHGKDDIQIRVGGDKNSEHYQSWGGSAWDKTEYVLGVAGRGHSALKAITYTPEFNSKF